MAYKVIFSAARDGGSMARIEGMISFPDRSWHPAPQPGEEWEVEVIGQNSRKTVCFLGPIRKIDREKEKRIGALVDAAFNQKRRWGECLRGGRFLIPYNMVYEKVAEEWVDRAEFRFNPYKGVIDAEGDLAAFFEEVATRVAHWERVALEENLDFRAMCEKIKSS